RLQSDRSSPADGVAPPAHVSTPGRTAVHLTSAHPRDDPRIFHKQCVSLARHGWRTVLVVADGMGNRESEGVRIIDMGRRPGRLRRILQTPWAMFQASMSIPGDAYELHDPELIPIGLLLRIRGKRVIFDSHENYPKGMLSKQYLPAWLRPGVAWTYALFERFACRFFDAVIGANPWITEHFDRFHPRAVHIDNYPRLEE